MLKIYSLEAGCFNRFNCMKIMVTGRSNAALISKQVGFSGLGAEADRDIAVKLVSTEYAGVAAAKAADGLATGD
jgi:hypothetical protein